MRGRDDLMGATSTLFRAPSGTWSATTATSSTTSTIRTAEAPCCRPEPAMLGARQPARGRPGTAVGRPLGSRTHPRRDRRTRSGSRDPAHRPLHVRGPAGRSVPARTVFLVGDAAHRVTPRGGTGMNTAIHDGYDLGWKLGWVLNGWAPEALLDCYESERRPVAEHNVAARPIRWAPAARPTRNCTPTWEGAFPPAGADGGWAALDSRPARPGADRLHRPGGGAAGAGPRPGAAGCATGRCGGRACAGPARRYVAGRAARMARRRRQSTGRGARAA